MKKIRKYSAIVFLLSMACFLHGCQKKDEIVIETAPEAAETDHAGYGFETAIYDVDHMDADIIDTEITDIEITDTEITDTEIADTEITDTEIADAEITDTEIAESNMAENFYYTVLTDEIKARITGKSYPDTEESLQVSYEDLAYVHVLHYDFEAQVQEGELICSRSIAQDLVDIFYELYESRYPIEKIRLIDAYDADDEASMADNNTSCFNYRSVPGQTKLSNHAYGYAIDINPLYNPYVRTRNGEVLVSPDNAVPYVDRSPDFPYKIDTNDLCYRIFMEHGFNWGGAWNSSKDYQHFEKTP